MHVVAVLIVIFTLIASNEKQEDYSDDDDLQLMLVIVSYLPKDCILYKVDAEHTRGADTAAHVKQRTQQPLQLGLAKATSPCKKRQAYADFL